MNALNDFFFLESSSRDFPNSIHAPSTPSRRIFSCNSIKRLGVDGEWTAPIEFTSSIFPVYFLVIPNLLRGVNNTKSKEYLSFLYLQRRSNRRRNQEVQGFFRNFLFHFLFFMVFHGSMMKAFPLTANDFSIHHWSWKHQDSKVLRYSLVNKWFLLSGFFYQHRPWALTLGSQRL